MRVRSSILLLGFAVVAAILYGKSLGNGFVIWDDDSLVTKNPLVQELSLSTVGRVFTSHDPELYVPLAILSYQVEHAIVGAAPLLYHVTNLLLHIGCAFIVYLLLRKWGVSDFTAVFGGLLFLVHPINSEAVLWVSARKDLLASFFALLTMLFYPKRLWLAMLFFLLALLSKSSVVMLPAVLLLTEWWRGVALRGSHFALASQGDTVSALKKLLPFIGLAIVFFIIAILGKTKNVSSLTLIETLLLSTKSFLFALGSFFWPFNLSSIYHQATPVQFTPEFLLSILGCIALFGVTLWSGKKTKVVMFALGIFVFFLLPSFANFWKDGELHYFSDRYVYLAGIGLIALLCILIDRLRKKNIAFVVLALILAAFAIVSFQRSLLWADSELLFRDALAKNPNSALMHFNMGVVEQERKDENAARLLYEQALALDPTFARAKANLGVLAMQAGDRKAAIRLFEEAIALDPDLIQTRMNLANEYGAEGRYEEALQQFEEAFKRDPSSKDLAKMLEKLRQSR